MLQKLPFNNIAHLGWAVRDIEATIKTFEAMGIGPWRRYILGENDGGHDFDFREYAGGWTIDAKLLLQKLEILSSNCLIQPMDNSQS